MNNFTQKEIEQIAGFVRNSSVGCYFALDMRKFSKNVKRWLRGMNMIEEKRGRWFATRFEIAHSMPVEVLWHIMNPIIPVDGIGYSLSKKHVWTCFNIYPSSSHHHSARDMQDMETILFRLHTAGYINYQAAGTVWAIYRTDTVKIAS